MDQFLGFGFVGLAIVVVAAYLGYRVNRYKGFRGALFGAEIRKTVGEIEGGRIGPVDIVLCSCYVERMLASADFLEVRHLALDETSRARGHDYV